ncbi:YigZ family protein [Melghirimyces algeriensis]|uniref:YigZ family protein n=1 Tax=Melghirimyces algeriensis TaxID=910412 RepID=UPI001158DB44|nr:YigZ family protein [Melghirimyces algeriensis]
MPTVYSTVKEYKETEILIQKSRFITYVNRVESEKEAVRFIQNISRRHWDATHNCYAYQVMDGQIAQKSSDDGEPAGTAGRPILEVLKNRDLINTVIVVTRYFGGIKLGAGGLIRAYSQSASTGLDAAGILDWVLHRMIRITVNYSAMGKVEYELRSMNVDMEQPKFSDKVHFTVWVPDGKESTVTEMVAEQTGGRGEVILGQKEYRPIPR